MKYKFTLEQIERFERAAEILLKNKEDCKDFPNIEHGDSEAKKKVIAELLERVYSHEVNFASLNEVEQNVVVEDMEKSIIDALTEECEYRGIKDMGDL